MRLERKITEPTPRTAYAERRNAVEQLARDRFPDADEIILSFHSGRYLATPMPSGRTYEVEA